MKDKVCILILLWFAVIGPPLGTTILQYMSYALEADSGKPFPTLLVVDSLFGWFFAYLCGLFPALLSGGYFASCAAHGNEYRPWIGYLLSIIFFLSWVFVGIIQMLKK